MTRQPVTDEARKLQLPVLQRWGFGPKEEEQSPAMNEGSSGATSGSKANVGEQVTDSVPFRQARIAFAAFMDLGAKFELQAYYWMRSLSDCAAVEKPEDIVLFVPETLSDRLPDWALRAGIRVLSIPYFDMRHPYCNKISLWKSAYFPDYDFICLTDCDVFFLRCPDLPLTPGISAAVVDAPNPPWRTLCDVYRRAGLSIPEPVWPTWLLQEDGLTAPTNCNGGFYFVSRDLIDRVGATWARWAQWLLDGPITNAQIGVHIDQVAFAMALAELNLDVRPLPRDVNVPTHLGPLSQAPLTSPAVLHYHSNIDEQCTLRTIGTRSVDESIAAANAMIARWKRDGFDNRLFWNTRYALFPALGSGTGSRGATLEEKRRLIAPFSEVFQSTIDIGCGDLTATKNLPFKNYLGTDLSDEALSIARRAEPCWRFADTQTLTSGADSAELVLCLDVVIHQHNRAAYSALVDLAVSRSTDLTLIAGYDEAPLYTSDIIFFHEPISFSLKNHAKVSRIERVGSYRDLVLYGAVKKGGRLDRNANQLKLPDLVRAFVEVQHPSLFAALYRNSLDILGFFTSHYPRVFEYSWLCNEMLHFPVGTRVLDVGAGVCPVPIWLATRGLKVVTIDRHTLRRTPEDVGDWSEWGFLDYSFFRSGILSLNMDILDLRDSIGFDVIYSISVVEHMAASERVKFISVAASNLRPDGHLFLTVDLIPGTNKLWNMAEGKLVEDEARHGSLETLLKEFRDADLTVTKIEVKRAIYGSRTDVAFICAKLPNGAATRDATFFRRLFKK